MLLVVFAICYLGVRFIWPSLTTVEFKVSTDTVKFHANETSNLETISAHIHSLSRTLQNKEVRRADISFAQCTGMTADQVDDFLPGSLGHIKDLKLNFGSTNIQDAGAEYIVNALPFSLEKLDISFDSIHSTTAIGEVVGTGLARLTHLKHLRLSFILSNIKD